jgi:chloramphenicol O-acetyltransferase type A
VKQEVDITSWNRKEHFEFFSKFEEPFFGIVATVDCTKAYENAKKLGVSFFVYYMHKMLCAVNSIENFRYRIDEGKVYVYDAIDVSATITRDDATFGFSLIPFHLEIEAFHLAAIAEIERVKRTHGLFTRKFEVDNLIHFSAIPWIEFTSLSHARSFTFPDSCPKISVGKMSFLENGQRTMPVSVHVHHGLMDGIHVGEFFTKFQELLSA